MASFLEQVGVKALASEPVKTLTETARKAALAAATAAVAALAGGIPAVTGDGNVTTGELVALVGTIAAAAVVGFGSVYATKNKPSTEV